MPPLATQGAGVLVQALSRLSDAGHEGRRDTVSSASKPTEPGPRALPSASSLLGRCDLLRDSEVSARSPLSHPLMTMAVAHSPSTEVMALRPETFGRNTASVRINICIREVRNRYGTRRAFLDRQPERNC